MVSWYLGAQFLMGSPMQRWGTAVKSVPGALILLGRLWLAIRIFKNEQSVVSFWFESYRVLGWWILLCVKVGVHKEELRWSVFSLSIYFPCSRGPLKSSTMNLKLYCLQYGSLSCTHQMCPICSSMRIPFKEESRSSFAVRRLKRVMLGFVCEYILGQKGFTGRDG